MAQPPDADRFENLYRQHRQVVLAYALRRTDAATAEDVLAETFLIAWRRQDEVPEGEVAWLLGVARRVLANRHRGTRRRVALTERLGALEPRGTPREVGDVVAEREHVRLAFSGLPDADRELLALVAWDRLSVEDAARVVGCTTTAAKVRLLRARRRLARRLKDPEPVGSRPTPSSDPVENLA